MEMLEFLFHTYLVVPEGVKVIDSVEAGSLLGHTKTRINKTVFFLKKLSLTLQKLQAFQCMFIWKHLTSVGGTLFSKHA